MGSVIGRLDGQVAKIFLAEFFRETSVLHSDISNAFAVNRTNTGFRVVIFENTIRRWCFYHSLLVTNTADCPVKTKRGTKKTDAFEYFGNQKHLSMKGNTCYAPIVQGYRPSIAAS